MSRKAALAAFGQAGEAALSAAQTALQARTRQAELRASIASAQIRAEADGIVGALYVAEGAIAGEGGLLGTVMEPGCGSPPAGRAEDLANVAPGAAAMVTSAEGKALGAAVLGQSGAPELDGSTGQAMQSLSFFPMDDGAWIGVGAGDRVVVDWRRRRSRIKALVPISAVGQS